MNEINNLIKNRRTELGLTQLDIAKATGVTEATVSRWESGRIANMRRSKIAALAKVLQLSPSTLMEMEPDPIQPEKNSTNVIEITPEENKLVVLYRELNNEGQDRLLETADDMVRSGKYIIGDSATLEEKITPMRVAARTGVNLDDAAPEDIILPNEEDGAPE